MVAECSVQGPLLPVLLVAGGGRRSLVRSQPQVSPPRPRQQESVLAAVHAACEASVSGEPADIIHLHLGHPGP